MRVRELAVAAAVVVAAAVEAAPAYAYLDTTLHARAEVSISVLGEPGIVVSRDGAAVVVRPVPPVGGPAPARYSVRRIDADGRSTVVCPDLAPTATCRDVSVLDGATGPAGPGYVVTAWLGQAWQRSSAPATVPAPDGAVDPGPPAQPGGDPGAAPAAAGAPDPDPVGPPTPLPDVTPSPSPTPSASPTPSPTPTPTPSPSPTVAPPMP